MALPSIQLTIGLPPTIGHPEIINFWNYIPHNPQLTSMTSVSYIGLYGVELLPTFIGLPTNIYDPCLPTDLYYDASALSLPAQNLPQNIDGAWDPGHGVVKQDPTTEKQDPSTGKWVVENAKYSTKRLIERSLSGDRPMTRHERLYYSAMQDGLLNKEFKGKPHEYYIRWKMEKLKYSLILQNEERYSEWMEESNRIQAWNYNYENQSHNHSDHLKRYWYDQEQWKRHEWQKSYEDKWWLARRNLFKEVRNIKNNQVNWSAKYHSYKYRNQHGFHWQRIYRKRG